MLEEIFGETNELVKKALTHPSYTQENNIDSLENYERLEFFGDSVLKLFTSKLLYHAYPTAPEGELSKIRSILVSDAILAQIAMKIGLDKLIKLGLEEENRLIRFLQNRYRQPRYFFQILFSFTSSCFNNSFFILSSAFWIILEILD